MTDREIRKAAKGFVKGLLGNQSTTDMCFWVCSPLASYLQFCGIECSLTEGEIFDSHHFWITFSDERIIDPTADQFGLPNIWLQSKPSSYKEYVAKDFDYKIREAIVKFQNTIK